MNHRVIIPNTINPPPSEREVSAANILARHYKTTVEFIAPIQSYKHKTPDIIINGLMWEIKSPIGHSKRTTVEKQIKKALRQSGNIVFDSRHTKLTQEVIVRQLLEKVKLHKKIFKIILISKAEKVIEVYNKR